MLNKDLHWNMSTADTVAKLDMSEMFNDKPGSSYQ